MEQNMRKKVPKIRTVDIARRANIHVNTVRFYERIGLISEVPRDANNYRIFSEQHLYQVLVLRYLFLDEWPGKTVRKASYGIIEAMKQWDIQTALQQCSDYLKIIQKEIDKTTKAVAIIKDWPSSVSHNKEKTVLDFRQAAKILGTTRETIRNWERNRLIFIPRKGSNNSRYFTKKELDRLRVIYMLRQSRISIAAIFQALRLLDQGKRQEAVDSLELPDIESVISTGDHVLEALCHTRSKATELSAFLQTIPI